MEGATRYDATPMKDDSGVFAGFALFDPETEQLFLGTDTELTELDLADAQLTTLGHHGPDVRRVGRRPHRGARR